MTSSSCTQRRSTRITSNCRAGLGKAALCRLAVALLSSEEEAGRVLGSLGFLEVSVVIEREQGLAMTNDSSTTSFQQSADINSTAILVEPSVGRYVRVRLKMPSLCDSAYLRCSVTKRN